MKKLILSTLLVSSVASAGVLDSLKHKPASKCKAQLALAAFVLSNQFKGEPLKGSKFNFLKFSESEEDGKLGLRVHLTARSKYLTQDNCNIINQGLEAMLPSKEIVKDLWSGLSDEQYQKLANEVFVKAQLVDRDNHSLSVSC